MIKTQACLSLPYNMLEGGRSSECYGTEDEMHIRINETECSRF